MQNEQACLGIGKSHCFDVVQAYSTPPICLVFWSAGSVFKTIVADQADLAHFSVEFQVPSPIFLLSLKSDLADTPGDIEYGFYQGKTFEQLAEIRNKVIRWNSVHLQTSCQLVQRRGLKKTEFSSDVALDSCLSVYP